jgi:hypothetical protein
MYLNVTVRTSRQPTHAEIVNLQKAIATELQHPVALKFIDVPTVKLDPLIPPTHTPTPRPSPSQTPTLTGTPWPTAAPTSSATPSATPTATWTPTPTPTFTPTPVAVVVAYTQGLGLVLRDAPDGKRIGTLPEGTPVQILYHRETVNRIEWIEIRDVLNRVGWVALPFVAIQP